MVIAFFCTFENGTELTFVDFDLDSDALASALASLDVTPGHRVMALGANSRSFLITWLAAMKRSAIFMPINTKLKGAFMVRQFRNSEPRVVFVDAGIRAAFNAISLDELTVDFTILIQPQGNIEVTPLAQSELLTFDALARTPPNRADVLPATPGLIVQPYLGPCGSQSFPDNCL